VLDLLAANSAQEEGREGTRASFSSQYVRYIHDCCTFPRRASIFFRINNNAEAD